MFVLCANECTLTFWVLHLSSVLVIQQRRKGTRRHEINANISPVLRGRAVGVTQRRVGTCQGQQSPQCCSWLFPEWDLQPWVTCPADKQRGGPRSDKHLDGVRCLCTLVSSQLLEDERVLPGRLLSDWGWGVCVVLPLAGSDAGSATGTRPHWGDPGTGLRSDCFPPTHLRT